MRERPTVGSPAPARAPGDVLLHPLALAALASWVLNDHLGKPLLHLALPGEMLTGKLSDVASLAFFPLLPIAARELVLARARPVVLPSRAWALGWIAATGAVMATINTIDLAADAYRWGLGALQWPFRALLARQWVAIAPVRLWMDPTDLLTLPALAVPLALTWRRGAVARSQAPPASSLEAASSLEPASRVAAEPSRRSIV